MTTDDRTDLIRIRSPWGCGSLLLMLLLAGIGAWTVLSRLMGWPI